ncbi:hypothetical protein ACWF94_03660 [Streptomyces sp. NPDC055078]
MTTTATHLRQIVLTWPDLTDALGTPTQHSWPPAGLRTYLAAIEAADAEDAHVLRALERSPEQIGVRPVPIRLAVHDTMRAIEAALAACADIVAADVQIEPIPFPGGEWPAADRARRETAARADVADPRRWRFRGNTPRAPYTALWLLARVEGRPGPFRRLTDTRRQHIGAVARGAAERIEQVLDTGERTARLAQPCPCGGQLTIHGGAGTSPTAICGQCGQVWTTRDTVSAA